MNNYKYQVNDNLIVYLKEISNDKFDNPRIIVSHAHPKLIEELFKREVPEIANGTIEIKKLFENLVKGLKLQLLQPNQELIQSELVLVKKVFASKLLLMNWAELKKSTLFSGIRMKNYF